MKTEAKGRRKATWFTHLSTHFLPLFQHQRKQKERRMKREEEGQERRRKGWGLWGERRWKTKKSIQFGSISESKGMLVPRWKVEQRPPCVSLGFLPAAVNTENCSNWFSVLFWWWWWRKENSAVVQFVTQAVSSIQKCLCLVWTKTSCWSRQKHSSCFFLLMKYGENSTKPYKSKWINEPLPHIYRVGD